MKSFRLRMVLWFTVSLIAICGVFAGVTFLHLDRELRRERWERETPGHQDWVLHGSYSQAEVTDIMGELVRLSLIYSVPVLVLATVSGYILARRAMAPVSGINQQLAAIGAKNLDRRLKLEHADREFSEIERNINALLERLETSFHQINEFSVQVAHDLRTPLTLMRLQVEEAAGRIEPSVAESLQEELGRLSDYVDQCLLVARAEQGRVAVHPADIDLCATLREMIETYELLAREEERNLTIDAARPCIVRGDPTHLRQILHNLLTNALKHGHGNILVTAEGKPGHEVIRIANAIKDDKTASSSGLGLGLRIVRALAALSPGFSVSTRIEGGRFIAELTVQSTNSAAPAPSTPPSVPAPVSPPRS